MYPIKKKKINYISAIALAVLMVLQFSAIGQKIESLEQINRHKNQFLGEYENVHFYNIFSPRSRKKSLRASVNGKTLKEVALELKKGNHTYNPEKILLLKDEVMVLYMVGEEVDGSAGLYAQKYDKNLNPTAETMLTEFDDGTKRSQKTTPFAMFSSVNIMNNKLSVDHHDNSNHILIRYSFRTRGDDGVSYGRLLLMDKRLKAINEVDFVPSNPEHQMDFYKAEFSEQGDALVFTNELSKEENKRGQKTGSFNQIEKSGLIFIPRDGSDARSLELLPHDRSVKGAGMDNKYDGDGKISYAIVSLSDDEGTVNVKRYKYHPENDELENDVISIELASLPNYMPDKINNYTFTCMRTMEDGSNYIALASSYEIISSSTKYTNYNFHDNGLIVLKAAKDGTIQWANYLPKYSIAVNRGYLNGYANFLDQEGNLNLIFNTNRRVYDNCQKMLINGEKPKMIKLAGFSPKENSVRVAKYDLMTGKITLSTLPLSGPREGRIVTRTLKRLDHQTGEFRLETRKQDFIAKMSLK